MVFLGEWCKRYSRRSYWGPLAGITLPSAIQEERIFETIHYLQEVYEKLLPVLAGALNDVHGLNFSTRYWRIVLGPWFLYYLHILHDKYSQVISLKQRYPDFTTTCLDESCFVAPDDTLMFVNFMKGDPYNLQLYSQLFGFLGYRFPTAKTAVKYDQDIEMVYSSKQKKMATRLACLIVELLDRVTLKRKKIIFESIYFQKPALLKLILKMKGQFLPYIREGQMPVSLAVNQDMRKKIAGIKFGDTEFEKILMPMISSGLPKSMLEGFAANRANIRRKCMHPPRAIMSAVGWYYDEGFKMFAAESAESKTVLLGVQHGGSYGMLEYSFQEEHELGLTDKFFSWGWTRNDCHAKIEAVSATKLIKEKHSKGHEGSNDILYVTNIFYRFMLSYPISTDFWKDYSDQQSLFLSHLSNGVKERLVIRPHREDGGMDYKERYRDIIPDVRVETWAKPFSERDYGLLVCDHPCYATTFIESLVNNRPAILFANPRFAANRFNQRAAVNWNRLKAVGIAHDGPLEASKKIEEIYESVDDWWQQPQRQEASRLFLSEFGRVTDQWEKEWGGVLRGALGP